MEWWAHRRPHSSGHQMHFDSDNEGRGGVRNPIVRCVVAVAVAVAAAAGSDDDDDVMMNLFYDLLPCSFLKRLLPVVTRVCLEPWVWPSQRCHSFLFPVSASVKPLRVYTLLPSKTMHCTLNARGSLQSIIVPPYVILVVAMWLVASFFSSFCLSVVVYVTGDVGGPTLVTTQRLTSKRLADRGWIVHPRVNRVCMFDGGVLHGVIPGRGVPPAAVVASSVGKDL